MKSQTDRDSSVKRLLAWGCAAGLAACQLVAGITEVSRNGPCTNDSDCPASEKCVVDHCQAKSASGGAGSGAKGGAGGSSGVAANGGQKSTGGSSGRAGSTASGGGSGMSQAGAAVTQGGDGGRAGGSGGGSSVGGASGSGDAGEGGAGDATGAGGDGTGGRAMGGTGGGGAGGGGAGGAGAGGASAGMAGTAGSSGGMAGTGGAGPVRIMPLGDGITASTCMRAFLWKELTDNAYPAFDFVGTRTSADSCSPTDYDKNHEGHAGYRVSDLLSATSQHTDSGDTYTGSSADLALWFDGHPADIVLMLLGSNDFLNTTTYTAADVQNAYSSILAKLRSVNARVTLLVALLPPMSTSKCNSSCTSRRSDLVASVPSWAATASTTDSRVVVVDMTAFDIVNTTDGVKPNDTGAQWLADRWYQALDAL
jgi:lysophospholipase L1-like esterase